MSIIKDPSGRRSIRVEVELPGTPEQVWQAIATGPGISTWFAPSEVEEREGGSVVFRLGDGVTSRGTVKTWQPPHRFTYEEPGWSEGAPPLASEWIVEARAGGRCVVRVVSSLFTSSDAWDEQLESQESGWPTCFEILRLWFTHFPGKACSPLHLFSPVAGPEPEAWTRITRALGLEGVCEGEFSTDIPDAPQIAGFVERSRTTPHQHELTLRLARPGVGLASLATGRWEEQVFFSAGLYFFGEDAEELAAFHRPRWQRWLDSYIRQDDASG